MKPRSKSVSNDAGCLRSVAPLLEGPGPTLILAGREEGDEPQQGIAGPSRTPAGGDRAPRGRPRRGNRRARRLAGPPSAISSSADRHHRCAGSRAARSRTLATRGSSSLPIWDSAMFATYSTGLAVSRNSSRSAAPLLGRHAVWPPAPGHALVQAGLDLGEHLDLGLGLSSPRPFRRPLVIFWSALVTALDRLDDP